MITAGSAIIKMIHVFPGQVRFTCAGVNFTADIINAFSFAFGAKLVGNEPVTASFCHVFSHRNSVPGYMVWISSRMPFQTIWTPIARRMKADSLDIVAEPLFPSLRRTFAE